MFSRREILASALGAGVAVASTGTALANQHRKTGHVVLIGDSIFDNGRYVGKNPAVIDQLKTGMPDGWQATLLAIDGSVTRDVSRQLERLPADATHLVVSVGGNDALAHSGILMKPAKSAAEVFLQLAAIREGFKLSYEKMAAAVIKQGKPTVFCTVYDPNFDELLQQRMATTALSIFNDSIFRCAGSHGMPVLDLRLLFDNRADYANPIEPSSIGGEKIVKTIRHIIGHHDFGAKQTVLYS